MKKNDCVVSVCSGYTHEGLGVVKKDGFPLFVKQLLEGEEAKLVVTKVKKTYGYGRVQKIQTFSDQRREPFCPLANVCGGCQLQHMSETEQKKFKRQLVQDVIDRIAKLNVQVADVISMEHPFAYRNKGQIPVGKVGDQIVCGFYRIHSNDIVDMESCPIQSDEINRVLACIRRLFHVYLQAVPFLRHILIKHAFHTGQIMVVFIARKKEISGLREMIDDLVKEIRSIQSVILNVNQRADNVILGDEEYVLYGERTIIDKIHDLSFCISSKSFYQVNPSQTEVLYGKVLEFAQLTGEETVLDLYCGVGTISMFLAQKAKSVVGIEIVPQAIEDAKRNAALNSLTNVQFVCSDAAAYASEVSGKQKKIDVVVVDPPRKGCDELTLNSIVRMQPGRIVYVSCNPSTLARDLRILEDQGYRTEVVQPVDMFPHTYHVETVVLMSRVEAK